CLLCLYSRRHHNQERLKKSQEQRVKSKGQAMNEFKLKEQICEIGRRVYAKGFAAANDGNISIRLNDKEILCTPTMVSKGYLKPEDLCVVDYDGKQLRGTRKRST